MRKPKVKNKYNLTVQDLKRLRVGNRDKICAPLFWRNNAISGWCISGTTIKNRKDDEFGTYDEFWIGVYDEDAKSYAGKIRVTFSAYGGMCHYNFKKFFDYSEIEHEMDLEIQEKFIETINKLLDEQILVLAPKS